METLDLTDGFSIHDYRHGLKLLRQDGERTLLENRAEYACPACGDPFERLLVTENAVHSFQTPPSGPICLARTGEKLLVLTH
ncbi:hypothetical protein HTSR_0297 [Halodesulfurarchaeum formicicum]|uniref:Flagella cluster protein n=1 Tax=Halodesulfurarchaeum formicicum TaxID=1873524 RepID=A0A1D8S2A7_9EURY|nr:flagella cluster protein [Halodesulfurarchaeum formicicum]AOW79498.1 hypothetical protein HTSR_0297 [Halodesulfurarchaeum formicicum]